METFSKMTSPEDGKKGEKVTIKGYGKIDPYNKVKLDALVQELAEVVDPELDAEVERVLQPYPTSLAYMEETSSYWRGRSSSQGPTRTKGPTLALIQALQKAVSPYTQKLPTGYEEVWRFHSAPAEYQSHQYREAVKSGTVVPNSELEHWAKDPILVALHMFKSSLKSNSVCVSYARSLDKLLDESYHVGADSSLAQTIRGGDKGKPAALLAYTQIPSAQLVKPEKVEVPKYTYTETSGSLEQTPLPMKAIERLSEARDRAIRETEALHLPLSGSGGCTYLPLAVFENPFPQVGKTSEPTLKQLPESFLKQYK